MGRIENHPILGPSPEGKTVTFYYNGTLRDRKMHRLRNDRGWETECQNLHHSFERRNEG